MCIHIQPVLTYNDIPDSFQRIILVLIGNRNDVISDAHTMPLTAYQLFCVIGIVLQILNTMNPIYTVIVHRWKNNESISTPLFNLLPYYIWILSAYISAHFSYSLLPAYPLIYVRICIVLHSILYNIFVYIHKYYTSVYLYVYS